MTIITGGAGPLEYPEPDIAPDNAPEGAKTGYLGEDGDVKVVARREPGFSNAAPSVEHAQAQVDALERALEAAQKNLVVAKKASAQKKSEEKPLVGEAGTTTTPSKTTTETPPSP